MRILLLSNGAESLIDEIDFDWASEFNWHAMPNGRRNTYAFRWATLNRKKVQVYLHLEVLAQAGKFKSYPRVVPDHANRNSLDNRRINIDFVTRQQNVTNSGPRPGHKYKGVRKRSNCIQRWEARGACDGKTIYLGHFGSEQEAARAYDGFAKLHYGPLAYLNFPDE